MKVLQFRPKKTDNLNTKDRLENLAKVSKTKIETLQEAILGLDDGQDLSDEVSQLKGISHTLETMIREIEKRNSVKKVG